MTAPIYPEPAGRPLRVAVRAPERYRAKARYALRHLLTALSYAPDFVEPGSESDLAYGEGPEGPLAYAPEAAEYFARRERYDAGRVRWAETGGERVPLLFGEDLVASAFFWLSGWQEHVVRERDQHGRFPFAASLQSELGVGTLPVVEAYRDLLAGQLRAAGLSPEVRRWGDAKSVVCLTCDVDHLRAWRAGTIWREVNRFANTRDRVRLKAVLRDARVGDSLQDSLARFTDLVIQRGGTATIFLKAGRTAAYDGPVYLKDRRLRRVLERQMVIWREAGFEVGLHPSYHAHAHLPRLVAEREALEAVWGAPVTTIRQHYLRDTPAVTPHVQIAAGFTLDATLGWPDALGFRNGTCLPFRRYDCHADRPHDLWEMPLAAMDGTLFIRLGMTPGEATNAVRDLTAQTQRYGGACVLLWHNHAWDRLDHDGWHRPLLAGLDTPELEALLSLDAAPRVWLG
jgi:hypothetical protein